MQAKRERFAGLQLKIILLFMGLLVGLANQTANSFDDNLVKQKTISLCKYNTEFSMPKYEWKKK